MRWLAIFLGFGAVLGHVGLSAAESAESVAGVVFEDTNANGLRDPGEDGISGVYVQLGALVSKTDETGRYVIEGAADAARNAEASKSSAHSPFVVLTRPRGFDCDRWYQKGGGDFALRPRETMSEDFVFVHMSDAHISDRPADVGEFGIPRPIAKLPKWLGGIAMWGAVRLQAPQVDSEVVVEALRRSLADRHDVSGMSDVALMGLYVHEVIRHPKKMVDPAGDFGRALEELRSLQPAFVVSTGDLVIESNNSDAKSIERWMKFYANETRSTGLNFYDTIGNNELAGTENVRFKVTDPGYGKALFRERFGPTYYSFDRGDLHFVALDTHEHTDLSEDDWSSQTMEVEVREWLEIDLANHRDRRVVALNHEPFRGDPAWSMPETYVPEIENQEWLREFNVPYTLSGHLHINGTASEGGTQHVMTGALSGLRWTLPPEVFPRGYRLVQVRDGELFTAWKGLGEPLLGFVTPVDASMYATAPLKTDARLLVIAAADTATPFAEVSLRVDGEPVALERWSDFFFAAELETPAAQSSLRVEARTQEGRVLVRKLDAFSQDVAN